MYKKTKPKLQRLENEMNTPKLGLEWHLRRKNGGYAAIDYEIYRWSLIGYPKFIP